MHASLLRKEKKKKKADKRKFIKDVSSSKSKSVRNPLLLEKATELVHHGVAATVVGRRTAVGATGGWALVVGGVAALAVLLDGVFGDGTDDGTTNCSKESVIGLVAGKATGGTSSEGTSETTLALLSFTGGTLLLLLLLLITTVIC
jgi:hypothetical protein